MIRTFQDVLDFWFKAGTRDKWFNGGPEFDREIRQQFYTTWQAACRGELFPWRESLEGRLAEIIVLDQFSRNLNRGSTLSFTQDGMALILTQELINQKDFNRFPKEYYRFALMPLMHSESEIIQGIGVKLFKKYCDEVTIKFALEHQRIIQEFGRFPHRNQAIGRASSYEELAFISKHDGF